MVNNAYGRPCPSSIRQQLPCPYQPCYEWRPVGSGNWTDCLLDGAQCGTGVRRQLLTCILAETGKAVDEEFCRLVQPSASHVVETPCKVLCSFGKDRRWACAGAAEPWRWRCCCCDAIFVLLLGRCWTSSNPSSIRFLLPSCRRVQRKWPR